MKSVFLYCFLLTCLFSCNSNETIPPGSSKELSKTAEYAIVIHGGAGTILRDKMSDEKEEEYIAKLNEALNKGESILKSGGKSIDAVVETIKILEDSPLFNAGKGAVFTNNETNEMDASIMTGIDSNAGAVAGISNIKNPITAARKVLEESNHVLLSGVGAETFAAENGCEVIDPSYFRTERRLKSLLKAKGKEDTGFDGFSIPEDYKFGTVGCVALDKEGNIVAGTSTGGMTNKKYGRVGDSPIIGAGTFADNNTCGVSATGHGEFFIRYAVAHDIAARMEYKNIPLDQAANEVVMQKLVEKKGSGGIIALDKHGNVTMPFNTPGMYRGYSKPGIREVKIFKD